MDITIKTLNQMISYAKSNGYNYSAFNHLLLLDEPPGITEEMNALFGKTIEVENTLYTGTYRAKGWSWKDWMISKKEGVSDE